MIVEFHYSQIYCNSVGMQAACERAFLDRDTLHSGGVATLTIYPQDQCYSDHVIMHSCALLEKVVMLSETGRLRYAPVRIYIRVTTATIFLLKALAIGARNEQVISALAMLDRIIGALELSVVDDMHLANDYAALMRTYVDKLQKALKTDYSGTRFIWAHNGGSKADSRLAQGVDCDDGNNSMGSSEAENAHPRLEDNDWFSLPFDPTMAPLFPCGDPESSLSLMQDVNMDFLWKF